MFCGSANSPPYCSEDSADNIVVMAVLEEVITPVMISEECEAALQRGA